MALSYRVRWRLNAWLRPAQVVDDKVIVIGGCGSSGTTLFRVMLDRHPDVSCGWESRVFLGRVPFVEDVAKLYGLHPQMLAHLLRTSPTQVDFIEAFRLLCLSNSGKSVWAEKSPGNVRRFGFVRRYFPNAHLVHIIRDGRDTVCSLRHRSWMRIDADRMSDAALERCAGYWVRRVSAGLRHRSDPLYQEVRYEDLVQRPEATMRRVLKRLELPWDSAMMASTRKPSDAAEGEIRRDRLGRWRQDIDARQLALVNRHIGSLQAKLGYHGGVEAAPESAAEQAAA